MKMNYYDVDVPPSMIHKLNGKVPSETVWQRSISQIVMQCGMLAGLAIKNISMLQ